MNKHYLAIQIKNLASFLDSKVLYPMQGNDIEELIRNTKQYERKVARLGNVVKLSPTTINTLVTRVIKDGTVWSYIAPFTDEDATLMWEEHDSFYPQIESASLQTILNLVWGNKHPGRNYLIPSTLDVIDMI